jgi:hypothetical protein
MRIVRVSRLFLILLFIALVYQEGFLAATSKSMVCYEKGKNNFALSVSGITAPLYVSSEDYPGVIRVLKQLQTDIGKVTNVSPHLIIVSSGTKTLQDSQAIVLVGTIGKSPIIDKLIQEKKLDVQGVAGQWETFLIQVVNNPFPHVDRALIIAGSDKRGTIYGMYDLSEKIGVSPWYWWADVPVKQKSFLFISLGRYTRSEPKVKYRGIFINDEAPALSGLVHEKFGGFTSAFYEHVFELLLRLKGNYLWPAMWNNSFSTDDTLNLRLADEYGIVMGTSHHEPMMRAWKEWEWEGHGKGSWDYSKNGETVRKFWTEGIRRTKDYEKVVTLAMRGDGDEPMSEGANIELLQNIVKDQRKILGDVTNREVSTIPQVWALYKEVQEYYDKGMRVPDDVTILLCDDNWGNIRKLPKLNDQIHSGGYGMYYHFDFVGGPRNYKWLNTIQIERVWEQMHLAYEYGADRIWIVNVGDIKPMEFPVSFFLDYAWDPTQFSAEDLPEYTRRWAEAQFGASYANEIAEIINAYTKFNSRCKPELLSPETYNLVNYQEGERIVAEYNALVKKAQDIGKALPAEYEDAYFQLVLHQPSACANLNDLYVTVGTNYLYAKQGRAATNTLAQKARELFAKDSLITQYYNVILAGGKWNHLMDQTHIGYTSWQQPERNVMPKVVEIQLPDTSAMGVAVEGSEEWWPNSKSIPVLPEFDVYHQQEYSLQIFNRGKTPFVYSVHCEKPWIHISSEKGMIDTEERIDVRVNWNKIPPGKYHTSITISGPGKTEVAIQTVINNIQVFGKNMKADGFVEGNGFVSMNAEEYTTAKKSKDAGWVKIPNLGRTGSAMTSRSVTLQAQKPLGDCPRLEYRVFLYTSGEVQVKTFLSPTLNFNNGSGLRYAVSFDHEVPQIVNMHEYDTIPDWHYPRWWNQAVSENIKITVSRHSIQKPGEHILKIWMIDPGVVLQKIVVETGEVKPSYLGPPERFSKTAKRKK